MESVRAVEQLISSVMSPRYTNNQAAFLAYFIVGTITKKRMKTITQKVSPYNKDFSTIKTKSTFMNNKKAYTQKPDKKDLTRVPKDLVQNQYLVADRDTIWCVDSTFIAAGSLILIVDLATRLIVGHCFLHGSKHNEFNTQDVVELLQRCLKARQITEQSQLIIHSDRGRQFVNEHFAFVCKQAGIKQSVNDKPTNNQVIESLNGNIKKLIRLKIDPTIETKQFRPGTFRDPLRKLNTYEATEIDKIITFAIDSHNNSISAYNQKLSPFEFDNALFDSQIERPPISATRNDQSQDALLIQDFRNQVTVDYAQNWALFFADWQKKHDIQFEQAKRERAQLYEQNRMLIAKIEQQSEQIEELLGFQRALAHKEAKWTEFKEKRANAKKATPRDTISPEEFDSLIKGILFDGPKAARVKVALTLLYLTGLRVANLLVFTVRHLKDLTENLATPIQISKKGGVRKIVLGREAKKWFSNIEPEMILLTHNKSQADFLFCNKKGSLISRQRFTEQLNDTLKLFTTQTGKELKTHSFRITLITELLQTFPIQEVQKIIGHRDIKTTEVYNRNFLSERDYYKAVQFVYKKRAAALVRPAPALCATHPPTVR